MRARKGIVRLNYNKKNELQIYTRFRVANIHIFSSSPFIRNAKALGKNPSQISAIQFDAQIKCIIGTIQLDAQAKFPIRRLTLYVKGSN